MMPVGKPTYPPANAKLDYALSILGFLAMCGLMVDGSAHYQYVSETFFTPTHYLIYSTILCSCVVVMATAWINQRRGFPWNRALPRGYAVSLLGAISFVLAIPLDILWHMAVGTETDLGILLSPVHLLMGICLSLILLGPLQAALHETPRPKLIAQLPLLLSATAFLGIMEFFTQYAFAFDAGFTKAMAPAGYQYTTQTTDFALVSIAYYRHVLGLFAVLFHAVLIMGVVLFLARSFQLAAGAFTIVLVLSTVPVAAMLANDAAILAANIAVALLTGWLADGLYALLRPVASRILQFRVFAAVVPAAHYAIFFGIAMGFLGGVWWDPNLVLGSVVISAIIGYLMSILIAPPRYGPAQNWQT
jgi:hypothetical protein